MEKEILNLLLVSFVAILAILFMLKGLTLNSQNSQSETNIVGKSTFSEVSEKCSNIDCEALCFEQDNGNYPFVFGEIKARYAKDTNKDGCIDECVSSSFSDYCIDGSTLMEYFCDEKNLPSTKISNCANGCIDGECLPDTCDFDFCINSDGGDNIFLSGFSEYYKIDWHTGSCYLFHNSEYCTEDGGLMEINCRNIEKRNCPPGFSCKNGACIKE